MKKWIVVLLAACALCSSAMGMPSETSQQWYFSTDANPAEAEICFNAYAPDGVWAEISRSGTSGADPQWDSSGFWYGNTIKFTATIPNTNNTHPDSYKLMIVEIGFVGELNQGYVTAWGESWLPLEVKTETGSYGQNNEWQWIRHYYYIEPNPTSEEICYLFAGFEGGVQKLDYVIINTICAVPAPGAVILAGIGAGLVGWMRRRKNIA